MTELDELARVIEGVRLLRHLSKEALEATLGVKLGVGATANPFFTVFRGISDRGIIRYVHYQEPGPGARGRERSISLKPRDGVSVTHADLSTRFGPGEVADIIPTAAPEGLIVYTYDDMTLTFDSASKRFVSLGLSRPEPASS